MARQLLFVLLNKLRFLTIYFSNTLKVTICLNISFLAPLARLWNSLPKESFPLTYNLNGFQPRINRYLLTVGSF